MPRMNFFGSSMSSDVGLRLLLYPLGSNVVVRTACCSVGVVLPVYSTFKAIESKNQHKKRKLLLYWTVVSQRILLLLCYLVATYGSFTVAENFSDKLLYWCPAYYHLKFAFLVWLQLPAIEGSRVLYINYLRPLLLKHQSRLDQVVNFFCGEATKFVSKHETEIYVARTVITKILVSANQMVREVMHPTQRQIGGPEPEQ